MKMSILGLIGKLLSGPWMKKLYTSSETEIKYLEGIEVVRRVLKKLQEANKWPAGLLEAAQDFFCCKIIPPFQLCGKSYRIALQSTIN